MTDDDGVLARLARLEDERGVLRTLHRYGHAIDAGDEATWLDLFTEDGTFESRGQREDQTTFRVSGRDELTGFIRTMSRRPFGWHSHCVVEPLIDVDGDAATVDSYLFVLQEHEQVPVLRLFGRYHDELVRGADGAWRFRLRSATVDGMDTSLPPLAGVYGTS